MAVMRMMVNFNWIFLHFIVNDETIDNPHINFISTNELTEAGPEK